MQERIRLLLLCLVIGVIIGAIVYLQKQKVNPIASSSGSQQAAIVPKGLSMTAAEKAKKYPVAKEISTPDGFINTDKISIGDLIGKKVILVDFWTYSCINCQRTTPYLNAWYDKYKDQGLEIIGIHTPEFDFEKNYDNVKKAVEKEGIKFPVVLDNDYSTWMAYGNEYWPRKYLIDIDGYIVYDHIGEGAYDETEQKIQAALAERMAALKENGTVQSGLVSPDHVEIPKAQSPETYFGASRNNLGSGTSQAVGEQSFTKPASLVNDTGYLVGDWDIQNEYAQSKSDNASVLFRYTAENVYVVASSDTPVRAKVLIDGQPVGDRAGADVGSDGSVMISGDQLFELVADPKGVGTHTLELQIEKPGAKVFTFTFG